MTKSKIRKLLSILLGLVAAVCLVLGAVNLPKQNNAAGEEILQKLRIYTLLNATGDSVVESYVSIAKAEAQEAARASGGGMAAIREAVAKAEEETRALYSDSAQTDYSQIDTTGLSAAVTVYTGCKGLCRCRG